jgi:hypothetical protein
MSDRSELRTAAARVLDRDEVEGVLSSSFYVAPKAEGAQPGPEDAAE